MENLPSSSESELAARKAGLRKRVAERRGGVGPERAVAAARSLAETGLEFLGRPDTGNLSGFYPVRSEVDVLPLLARLSKEGWRTCLPVVTGTGKPLVFRSWTPGEPTQPGAWSIPVPGSTAPELAPHVMLVPLMAWDRRGYRLGYGGGFYDRTIANLSVKGDLCTIGVCYALQEVAEVPVGPYDRRLDWILTERGALGPLNEAS